MEAWLRCKRFSFYMVGMDPFGALEGTVIGHPVNIFVCTP